MTPNGFINRHPVLFRLTLLTLIPTLIGLVLIFNHLHDTLPRYEGKIVSNGIGAKVTISRDSVGVPYIVAKSDADAFFAMGYVHAQDRLWQMEMQRRSAAGRLSEILGENALMLDQFMRTLGLNTAAEQSVSALDPRSMQSLESYVAGVNAWLQEGNTLPVEYTLLDFKPEPWTVIDSLVTVNLLALNLNGNWREEINRLMLTRQFDESVAHSFFPPYKQDSPTTIKSQSNKNSTDLVSLNRLIGQLEQSLLIGPKGVGSNAWVVSGKHTKSGKPILANDPHLSTQIPSSFYVASIKGDAIEVSGATLPGLPIVIIGNNTHISWGATNMMADTQDLYFEQVNAKSPHEYELDGAVEKMKISDGYIEVKPEFPAMLRQELVPVQWRVRATVRGPVISDVTNHLSEPVSLQWTALEPNNKSYASFVKLNYAHNWASFRSSFKDFVAPALNFIYADKSGNIGYLGAGKIPIRKNGVGDLPVDGWTTKNGWNSYIPFDSMPQVYNPESGVIVTANNKVTSDDYPYHITVDWAPPYRAKRIESMLSELISSGKKITAQDIKSIQSDSYSVFASNIVPKLLNIKPADEKQALALKMLAGWDYVMTENSIPATIFHVWLRYIQLKILEDNFRSDMLNLDRTYYLMSTIENANPLFIEEIINGKHQQWCDYVYTQKVETCEAVFSEALAASIKAMTKLAGPSIDSWKWGTFHTLRYSHTPFTSSQVLEKIFDRKLSGGGGKETVNLGPSIYTLKDNYQQLVGPVFRIITDLGEENSAEFTLSTGQSGNMYSKYYDNMIIKHKQLEFSSLALSKSPDSKTLILTPVKRVE